LKTVFSSLLKYSFPTAIGTKLLISNLLSKSYNLGQLIGLKARITTLSLKIDLFAKHYIII